MSVALAPWHVGHETYLTGSVYAAAPGRRIDAARALVDAGISVHVDVMAPGEGLPIGVTVDEANELAEAVPRELLGIHLIGTAAGVRRLLPDIPGCGDLYLPIGIHSQCESRTWAAVWDEFEDTTPTSTDFDGYDGVLLMLLEPGTSGAADPSRLDFATTISKTLPVAVDGGVTPELIPACRAAGVTTMVVGRALITSSLLPEGQS